MLLLVQFLYRLTFGMAAAMAVTSPRLVTSGYYRNNAYVLLGMNVLAALVAWSGAVDADLVPPWIATAGAVVSYFCAAFWLYEKPRAGIWSLFVIGTLALVGALTATPLVDKPPTARTLCLFDAAVSGLVLGVTMAAMLLGHWYLNAPGMKIVPLQKLTLAIGAVTIVRAGITAAGLAHSGVLNPLGWSTAFEPVQTMMLALQWLAGVVGTLILVAMTWSTLKIPNTQAATGMLYVAVITTFLGELVGQLLSVGSVFPL